MRNDPRIEKNGFTQSPLGQAVSEVDRLRDALAKSEDALTRMTSKLWNWAEMRYSFTEQDDTLDVWQRLDLVYDRLLSERDEARAACAEMRAVLQVLKREHDASFREAMEIGNSDGFSLYPSRLLDRVVNALSSDCGRGWLSPEVAGELVDALQVLHDETVDYITRNHLGDPHHNQSMKNARQALSRAKESGR